MTENVSFKRHFKHHAFKALVPAAYLGVDGSVTSWVLSDNYFMSMDDVRRLAGYNCKWPVEVYDNGVIYIPTEREVLEAMEFDNKED